MQLHLNAIGALSEVLDLDVSNVMNAAVELNGVLDVFRESLEYWREGATKLGSVTPLIGAGAEKAQIFCVTPILRALLS